jgi:hypothetical protein
LKNFDGILKELSLDKEFRPEDIKDATLPDVEGIPKRALSIIEELKVLVIENNKETLLKVP